MEEIPMVGAAYFCADETFGPLTEEQITKMGDEDRTRLEAESAALPKKLILNPWPARLRMAKFFNEFLARDSDASL